MIPPDEASALERLADAPARETPARARRMLLVANPYATTTSPALRRLVVDALRRRFRVEAADTTHPGHATELCRQAVADGFDGVVVLGGDGTINEAANGLAGSATVLTCLPGGATNVYGRMLGIPEGVAEATEHLVGLAERWAPQAVDLGRVNERWFTFSAGAGLDATVVERVDARPALKARFGPWFYAGSAVATFLQKYVVDPPRVVATAGAERAEGVSVFVQNAQPYTYFGRRPIRLARRAGLGSGDLSAVILTRANAIDVPTIGFRLLSRRAPVTGHRRVVALEGVPGLRVRSADHRPVPVEVDGDFVGVHEEAVFTVLPGGLRVLR